MRCVLVYEEVQQHGARYRGSEMRICVRRRGRVGEQLKVVALLGMEGAEGRLRGG